MSRKLVFVVAFLAVLPVMMVSVNVQGDDPPKNAGKTPTQRKEFGDASDPFGGADNGSLFGNAVDAKPKASKLPHKPHVDPAKPKVNLAKPKLSSEPVLHGGENAILKALKQETSLEFVETPLKDVLDYLSEMHHIPIRIDLSALKEAGYDEVTPITCKLSGISLRSALEIILDELKLKWTIHRDVLMITSPEKAESDEYMYTKSYDVTDLLMAPPSHYDIQGPLDYLVNSRWSLAAPQATVCQMSRPVATTLIVFCITFNQLRTQ
jgi:hypothetical protein